MAENIKIKIPDFQFRHTTHGPIEKKVNLQVNAKSDASVGVPEAGSHSRSATEENAIAEGQSFFSTQLERASETVSRLSDLLSNSRANVNRDPYAGKTQKFKNDLQELFRGKSEKIDRLKNNINVARHNIDVFKNEHKLMREPRVTHWWHSLLAIGLILCLISYETYFNGSIFENNLRGGQAAGMAQALGISMVNVFLSFLMGMALPNMWYKEISNRVMGVVLFLSYLSIIAYINALFGVYITKLSASSSAEIDFESSFELGIAQVVGNPFIQLGDLNQTGQLFILVGILFAIISLVDGLFYRDIYWNYGALGNKHHKAKKELNDERGTLNKSFTQIKNNCIEDLVKTKNDQEAELKVWDIALNRLQALKQSFEDLVKNVEGAVTHCLDEYISINRAIRYKGVTTAVPAYWPEEDVSVDWKLSPERSEFSRAFAEIAQEILEDSEITLLVKKKIEEIEKKYSKAEDSVTTISDEYDSNLEQLQQN